MSTHEQGRAPADTAGHHDAVLQLPVDPHDHSQGAGEAPVTLVEYGDYQCPYCGQAYPLVKLLQERLGDDLRFVFRNFPLAELHPNALHAAEAAESVAAHAGPAAFWLMHDALFEHQQDSRYALDDNHLTMYADRVGADPLQVARDLDAGTHLSRVRSDFMSGVRSGVNGTPTFFINGERFNRNWADVDAFTAVLRRAAGERVST